MYSSPAFSPAAALCRRMSALRIQPRPVCTVLALSLLLLIASISRAQQNNTIATVAGGVPPNANATLATIPNPTGIAEDTSGNFYIAAQYGYYVYKVSPSGALSIFAGIGIYGYTGDGGPATSAALSAPVSVAVDNVSGKVYIIDNNRVRVVANGVINTFVNKTGAPCHADAACGDGGLAINGKLNGPQSLFVDAWGNLLIADTNDHRIRFVNTQSTSFSIAGLSVPAGDIVTVAGNGSECNEPTSPCGDGGSSTAPGTNGGRLDLPAGVAADSSDNIYIGDTRDQRIRCVVTVAGGCPNTAFPEPSVGWIVGYAGSGIFCPPNPPNHNCNDGQTPLHAEFHNPSGLGLDTAGNLYVADQWDNKIRAVTVSICPGGTTCVTTVAGTGDAGFAGDGAKAQKAELDGPLAVFLDAAGHMTVADSGNGRIRQVVSSVINTIAGGGSVGDNNPAVIASLANPAATAWDAAGANYYIADAAYNRVREVMANGNISTVAGTGQPTGSNPNYNGDGGSAVDAMLDSPNGVALDAAGNLYIADTTDSLVRAVNMQQSAIKILNVLIQPGDIATVAGSGNKCEKPTALCGDGAPATGPGARIDYPSSVAIDGHGNLFIADYDGHRVREVLAVAGPCGKFTQLKIGDLCTLAGTGIPGFTSDGIPAYTAELNHPFGVAADGAGNVYIADSANNRIRCVIGASGGCGGSSSPVGTIVTYALNGSPTFTGNNVPATSASRPIPYEVALDPAGNLFIGGGAALLVQRVDAVSQYIIVVAGDPTKPGNIGFAGDGGPATKATLDNLGLSVNTAGNLLIADQGNNRIREVDLVPVADLWNRKLSFPNTTVGQTSSPLTAKLQNSGLASLPISGTALGGNDPQDFAIASNSCTGAMPPESFCYVGVTFNPTQTGTRTATLTINTSLGAQVVTLVGTGQ
jgi:hypothetical protein